MANKVLDQHSAERYSNGAWAKESFVKRGDVEIHFVGSQGSNVLCSHADAGMPWS